MRAIHVSVRLAQVRGVLSHDTATMGTAPIKVFHYYCFLGEVFRTAKHIIVGRLMNIMIVIYSEASCEDALLFFCLPS